MRFSIKWTLAGMVYVAVAAAAFSNRAWYYADGLWLASLIAYSLSLVMAIFARGRRQLAAAGFVAFGGVFLLCQEFAPTAVPTDRLLYACGLVSEVTVVPRSLQYRTPPSTSYWPMAPAAPFPRRDETPIYRAADALAVTAFGLLGAVLAPVALRREGVSS